uniref:Uncharacterized protein n=1 Tax=Anguilla anguilla TaxID=7936 RepID=A0A0E9S8H9_ANGAN
MQSTKHRVCNYVLWLAVFRNMSSAPNLIPLPLS